MASQVHLICYPRDDMAFARHVGEVVEGMAQEMRPFEAAAEALLRPTYPLAVVSRRHSLGGLADDSEVWYVFRDGSLLPPTHADTA